MFTDVWLYSTLHSHFLIGIQLYVTITMYMIVAKEHQMRSTFDPQHVSKKHLADATTKQIHKMIICDSYYSTWIFIFIEFWRELIQLEHRGAIVCIENRSTVHVTNKLLYTKKIQQNSKKHLEISYFFRFYVMCCIFFDWKFSRLFIWKNKSNYLKNDDKVQIYSQYLSTIFSRNLFF